MEIVLIVIFLYTSVVRGRLRRLVSKQTFSKLIISKLFSTKPNCIEVTIISIFYCLTIYNGRDKVVLFVTFAVRVDGMNKDENKGEKSIVNTDPKLNLDRK